MRMPFPAGKSFIGAEDRGGYFNCVETEENVELSLVPRHFTTAMIATEMPAAIRPYSIAAAPNSSLRNFLINRVSGYSQRRAASSRNILSLNYINSETRTGLPLRELQPICANLAAHEWGSAQHIHASQVPAQQAREKRPRRPSHSEARRVRGAVGAGSLFYPWNVLTVRRASRHRPTCQWSGCAPS